MNTPMIYARIDLLVFLGRTETNKKKGVKEAYLLHDELHLGLTFNSMQDSLVCRCIPTCLGSQAATPDL